MSVYSVEKIIYLIDSIMSYRIIRRINKSFFMRYVVEYWYSWFSGLSGFFFLAFLEILLQGRRTDVACVNEYSILQ